ncbi:TrmH family RNA methyltransferase [Mycolicibacterium sarraceniae]|uniref:RNA methyltransferase n=1 Tax=Mycolicibacterium sarraceniae TaxID=1534348 RepID=A0A7I7SWP0_9MYCO|nr:RNA methyltransferase [Mycolicibacterium sarraceniae]BBY60619.1 RNA methyltransferase [Mycolicibacterium sarraceniae]
MLRLAGRRRAGRFLVEGANLVEAAVRRGLVVEVFATDAALARFTDLLTGVAVHTITDKAAKSLSDTVTPVGLYAVCAPPDVALADVLAARPRLVLVAVATSEPGNAGTLIRIADAMGADAVVLTDDSVDPYNGKCLRASAGSIFSLPVLEAPGSVALVAALRSAGLAVRATTLDADTTLDAVDLTRPTAWLFGSEAHGLSADVAALADERVRVPMWGSAESLNVAAAAAICMYESARSLRRQ